MDRFLKFSVGNAKLDQSGLLVHTFSLPSGHTCPGALVCKAMVDRLGKSVTDGSAQAFRCFSASEEAYYPTVRRNRWHNYDLLRGCRGDTEKMFQLLDDSLPNCARCVRIHVGGDFFSQAYFDAWLKLASHREKARFYGYTKSLPFWVKRLGQMPSNLVLIASRGGLHDQLINEHYLREATVVFHPEEAALLGLEEDHDDTLAMNPEVRRLALRLHGTQRAGSAASNAIRRMKKEKIPFGYGNGRRKSRCRSACPDSRAS